MYNWFSDVLMMPVDGNEFVAIGALVVALLAVAVIFKLLLKVFGS